MLPIIFRQPITTTGSEPKSLPLNTRSGHKRTTLIRYLYAIRKKGLLKRKEKIMADETEEDALPRCENCGAVVNVDLYIIWGAGPTDLCPKCHLLAYQTGQLVRYIGG